MGSKSDKFIWLAIGAGALIAAGGAATLMISTNVRRLAWAIANAERGPDEIASGVIARNNPGDIESNGSLITYTSVTEGWNALYTMIEGWFNGTSHLYDPSMTIAQVAQKYVGTSDWINWASNVSDYLGVSVDTPLSEI